MMLVRCALRARSSIAPTGGRGFIQHRSGRRPGLKTILMLLNYLKITLKVLGRNPFFTFVSMFGVVFTLMILLVVASFLDHLIAPHYPDVNRNRCLFVGSLQCIDAETGARRTGPPSYEFLSKYVSNLQTPQAIGIASFPSYANSYAGNRRLKLNLKFTNADFWTITAFHFTEGKAITRQNTDNGDNVAVISEKTRDDYFGENTQVVGQSISIENVSYRVIGVVENVPITRPMMAADVYLPYTVERSGAKDASWNGNYFGILLADSKADFPKIQQEYKHAVAQISLPVNNGGFTFNRIETGAMTYLENFLNIGIFDFGDSAVQVFYSLIGVFMLLFMLLPAINLVNLNVSRILERSSEIGVRKAFGASSGKLVVQFLVENIFITLLGGLLAAFLAWVLLRIFNDSGLIPGADLTINGTVLLVGLAVSLLFGLLSGVLPAFRMSRLHVIDALRGGEN